MLIKAKDLQVGDVIAGYTVKSCEIGQLFATFELETKEYLTESNLPLDTQIEVERTEYIKADKNLIVLAARYLRKEGYVDTAWELEALLENSTTIS